MASASAHRSRAKTLSHEETDLSRKAGFNAKNPKITCFNGLSIGSPVHLDKKSLLHAWTTQDDKTEVQ